ncbi:hypothetical protein ACFWAY_39230 [Rhodococcus sp. NPDC059968]|uniref:hypothetical protein n=1 Tax=Rhodococcus sp. NPDC059968 TaxID=3347017 RepID=UPI00367140A2
MFRRVPPLLLLIPLALVSACGGSGTDTAPRAAVTGLSPSSSATASPPEEPSAPSALRLLDSAPAGERALSGQVLLSPDRTSITLDLVGLQSAATYMAHVHEQTCADGVGGPHLKLDPAGSSKPPNEIHFMLHTAAGETKAAATETRTQPLPDRARSAVVHDAAGTKIACADLPSPS